MKNLIFVLFIVLIGCGGEDPVPSANGKWYMHSDIPQFQLWFTVKESGSSYTFSDLKLDDYTSPNSTMVLNNGIVKVSMPIDGTDDEQRLTMEFKYDVNGMVFNNITWELYESGVRDTRVIGYYKVKAERQN